MTDLSYDEFKQLIFDRIAFFEKTDTVYYRDNICWLTSQKNMAPLHFSDVLKNIVRHQQSLKSEQFQDIKIFEAKERETYIDIASILLSKMPEAISELFSNLKMRNNTDFQAVKKLMIENFSIEMTKGASNHEVLNLLKRNRSILAFFLKGFDRQGLSLFILQHKNTSTSCHELLALMTDLVSKKMVSPRCWKYVLDKYKASFIWPIIKQQTKSDAQLLALMQNDPNSFFKLLADTAELKSLSSSFLIEAIFTHECIYAFALQSLPANAIQNIKKALVNFGIYIPTIPEKIESQMKVFHTLLLAKFKRNDDVIEIAAFVLQQMCLIHPFQDANGRLGRFLANYILMSAGILPVIFSDIDKYNKMFTPAHNSKPTDFADAFFEAIMKSADLYHSQAYANTYPTISDDEFEKLQKEFDRSHQHIQEQGEDRAYLNTDSVMQLLKYMRLNDETQTIPSVSKQPTVSAPLMTSKKSQVQSATDSLATNSSATERSTTDHSAAHRNARKSSK